MHVPQRIVRSIDAHFSTVAILLRFVKHKLEGNRELAIARQYLKKGSLVIDVGARKGVYTWVMSRRVGEFGKVMAFEPNPENAATLRRVFNANKNVSIEECALSEHSGTGVFVVPFDNGIAQDSLGHVVQKERQTPGLSYTVQLTTLDEALANSKRPVSFVKIDVEGHELSVLRGSRRIIDRDRPVFFIEIEQRHAVEPISTRFDFLTSLDYTVYFLDLNGQLSGIDQFNLETMQTEPCRANRWFVNMFLFVPREHAGPP